MLSWAREDAAKAEHSNVNDVIDRAYAYLFFVTGDLDTEMFGETQSPTGDGLPFPREEA